MLHRCRRRRPQPGRLASTAWSPRCDFVAPDPSGVRGLTARRAEAPGSPRGRRVRGGQKSDHS
ncbi:MAG: hypothetical protein AVDCRST_MAG32-2150 [uncultured Nocardioides sp.]|uniref:Uncharacterized protein n=1 Tax=uncultured Nocardioides sp. TaxID=198441 RepID=A0A6J4NPV5_9ACTN|nr:MAG: hypothetical protein AVDCRST_MAG32-2150 [uncultured Nocardioides sp.]